MRRLQTLTPKEREKFRSLLVPCPHCGLNFRARGLQSHIFLVHVAAPAIERHQQQKKQAA